MTAISHEKLSIKFIFLFIIGIMVICHIKPDTLFADNGQTSKGNIEINIKEISLVKNS